ncbi:MAG: hypothetical protein LBR68_05480 [Lachnoclostridium sp.]|jgi:RHS repeat-associated protein|nr:hypothetical protein [Lachnoclostridium sp.]
MIKKKINFKKSIGKSIVLSISKRILPIILCISLLIGVFEPIKQAKETEITAKSKTLKQLKQENEQAKNDFKEENVKMRTPQTTVYNKAQGKKQLKMQGASVRYKDPKSNKTADFNSALQKVSSSENNQKDDKKKQPQEEAYYTNTAGDKIHTFPIRFGNSNGIISSFQNYQISLIPLGEEGEELSSESGKLQEEEIEDIYGTTKKTITGIHYHTPLGIQYQYESLNNGIHGNLAFAESFKGTQVTFLFRVKNAIAEIDGSQIHILNPKNQKVGFLSPLACYDGVGQVTEEGSYTLEPIRESPKGKEAIVTYRLTVTLPENTDHRKNFIQAESTFLWESEDSNLIFSEIFEQLQGKYIEKALLLMTETQKSEPATTIQVRPDISQEDTRQTGSIGQVDPNNEVLASFLTEGKPDTEQSIEVTDYVKDVIKGVRPNKGLTLIDDKGTDLFLSNWFYPSHAVDVGKQPSLIVTYYDEPEAPGLSLTEKDIKTGKNVKLTWWEAKAESLDYIEYAIQSNPGKKVIRSFGDAAKLGTKEQGEVTLPTANLPEGNYQILVRGVDSQGNPGKEAKIHLGIDHTAPKWKDLSLQPDTHRKTPSKEAPVIQWGEVKDDNFAGIEYRINQGEYITLSDEKSGRIPLASAPLISHRQNKIWVRPVDKAGNVGKEKEFTYYYDDTAPVIKQVRLNKNSEEEPAKEAAVVTYEIEEPYLKEVSIRVNGGKSISLGKSAKKTYSIPADKFNATNLYLIEVQATDQTGNVTTQTEPYFYSALETPVHTETVPELSESVLTRMSAFSSITTYAGGLVGNSIQNYIPNNVFVRERWDGNTEISWTSSSFRTVSARAFYEVYRSELRSFTPSANNIIHDGREVRDNFFIIQDNKPRTRYYYKVRAVLKNEAGVVMDAGSYSDEVTGTTLPSGEDSHRIGDKSYLPYTEFTDGMMNGTVEETQGNLMLKIPGLSVFSKELEVPVAPIYNSASKVDSGMGPGWLMPYSMRVFSPSDGDIYYQDESGGKYHLLGNGYEMPYVTNEDRDITFYKESLSLNAHDTYRMTRKENITYHFDARGRIREIKETNGDRLFFNYDSIHGNLTMISTGTNKHITFSYISLATEPEKIRLKKIGFPDGTGMYFEYLDNYLRKISLNKGNKTVVLGSFTYDTDGNLIRIKDGKDHETQITYSDNKMTNLKQPDKQTLKFQYDESGRQTAVNTIWDGVEQTSESITYDSLGRTVSQKDAAGLTTTYLYGDQKAVPAPNPNHKYDITEITREVVEQTISDPNIVMSHIKKVTEAITYDENGNIIKEKDEQGNTTEYQFNNTQSNQEDLPSKIIEKDQSGTTLLNESYQYDNQGNETDSLDLVSGSHTVTSYTGSGDEKTEHDTTYELDFEGEQDSTLISGEGEAKYDANGDLIKEDETSGSVNNKIQNTYDSMGRIEETRELRAASPSAVPICITDFQYDIHGREVSRTAQWPNVEVTQGGLEYETVTYDNNGNISHAQNTQGVQVENTYDNADRLIKTTTTTNGISQTTNFYYEQANVIIYDGKGGSKEYKKILRTEGRMASQEKITYTNALGQVVRSIENGIYTDYTYDAMGRLMVTYVMGTSIQPTGGKVTCQLYDIAGNVTQTLVNPGTKQASEEAASPTTIPAPTPTTTIPMPPNLTKPAEEIPEGYRKINLSTYQLNGGAVAYQSNLGVYVENTNSVHFQTNESIKKGDRFHVIVQGHHNGGTNIRSCLSTNTLEGASDIGNGYTGNNPVQTTSYGFRWEYTLTASSDQGVNLIFKGADAVSDLDNLMIFSIAVKKETPENAPLLLDLSNSTNIHAVGSGATAQWNSTEEAVKVATNQYAQGISFRFVLPPGTSLADYESLKYDIKFDSAIPVSWKQSRADVSSVIPSVISGAADGATYGSGPYYNESSISGRGWLLDQEIKAFDPMVQEGKTGVVYLSFGLNTGPTNGSDYGGNSYYLRKVRLVKKSTIPPENPAATRGPASVILPQLDLKNKETVPTVTSNGAGTLWFNSFTGYPSNFSTNGYDTCEVKLMMYSDISGTIPIKNFTGVDVSWTKICLNNSSAGSNDMDDNGTHVYNGGYGNGYALQYIQNTLGSVNPLTGELIVHFNLAALKDNKIPNCLTMQIGDTQAIKAAKVLSITWNKGVTGYIKTGGTMVTGTEYDSLGNVISETDELGVKTTYRYDSQKRVTEVSVDNGARKQTYQYDDTESNPGYITTWTTDAKGNRTSESTNAAGQIIEIAEYLGTTKFATKFEYDTKGNVIKITYPNRSYVQYTYDEKGQLRLKQGYFSTNGKTRVEYEYNKAGNVVYISNSRFKNDYWYDLRTEIVEYDNLQRKISQTAIDGTYNGTPAERALAKISYAYDENNRLSKITYPKPQGLKSMSFIYDSDGKIQDIKGIVGSTTRTLRKYQYNEYNMVETIEDSLGYLTGGDKWLIKNYQYDEFLRVSKMEYADSRKTDTAGVPIVQESFSYQYDLRSLIVSEKYESKWANTNSWKNSRQRFYQYNRLGMLVHSTDNDDYRGDKSTFYEYDKAGNLTKKTENGEETTYEYNGRNQLVNANTSSGREFYSYDENGNLRNKSLGNDQIQYSYDAENRLLSVEDTTYTTIANVLQEYEYAGTGQRMKKVGWSKKNGTFQEQDINYFYQGTSALYTTSGNNVYAMSEAETFYLYGTEQNVMFAEEKTSGTVPNACGYTKDIRGSTSHLIDTSDRESMATFSYSDYGETTETILSGHTHNNEILYTGGIYDKLTEDYYLNARYYDPENGRFLTEDSYRGEMTEANTWNLYMYTAGNPINFVDPSGHILETIFDIAGMFFSAKDMIEDPSWINAGFLAWDIAATFAPVVPGSYVVKGGKTISNLFEGGSKVAKVGKTITKGAGKVKSIGKKAGKKITEKAGKVTKRAGKKAGKKAAKKAVNKKEVSKKAAPKAKDACFVAGTKILTSKGEANIEDVKVGDMVWAENPETGEKGLKRVLRTFVHEKDELIKLSIGEETITTTAEHPFYVPDKGWVLAGNLHVGDVLLAIDDEYQVIDEIKCEKLKTPIKVYNFEVEDFHTYFVSDLSVLVHNKPMRVPKTPKSPSKMSKSLLKKNKIDAHDFKEDVLGTNKGIAHWDIFQDTSTKKVWLKSKKGVWMETGKKIK